MQVLILVDFDNNEELQERLDVLAEDIVSTRFVGVVVNTLQQFPEDYEEYLELKDYYVELNDEIL